MGRFACTRFRPVRTDGTGQIAVIRQLYGRIQPFPSLNFQAVDERELCAVDVRRCMLDQPLLSHRGNRKEGCEKHGAGQGHQD